MVPASFNKAEEEQDDGTYQPLPPESIPALQLANESLSHKIWALCQELLLCWALANWVWHQPFQNHFSVCCSPTDLVGMSSIVFKARCFEGSSFRCSSEKLGCPMWKRNPSLLMQSFRFEFPSDCGSLCQGGDYGDIVSAFLPAPVWLFLVCPMWKRGLFVCLWFLFSEKTVSYVATELLCVWEEVGSGSSYIASWAGI